jgi:hypothetical protein
MDILREIKEAEAQAERIEREYHAKSEELISSVSLELQREKARREEALAGKIDALHAQNAREKEKTRQSVISQAASESAAMESHAAANMQKAVDLLIEALDL